MIAKASHASGLTAVFPGPVDRETLRDLCREWLAVDYAKYNGEWAYSQVGRAVVVERLLQYGGAMPHDYKFWCFGGRVGFLNFSPELLKQGTRAVFTRDLEWLPVDYLSPRGPAAPALSPRIAAMIDAAERLAQGFDFVRVDLLEADEGFYAGELTIYPSGGAHMFDPDDWDTEFGALWTLDPAARPITALRPRRRS